MLELRGKYNGAKVFTDNIENGAISQIIELCNQEVFEDAKIRIMPDAHKGAGCVIGFTADLGDKVIPNIVGVDIGCGMLCVELGDLELDLESIDKFINNHIPSGFSQNQIEQDMSLELRSEIIETSAELMIDDLRPRLSVGSLGGGNHFIEIANDENGNSYLIIHSGSRNFGYQIAKYYQDLATTYIKERVGEVKRLRDREIGLLKQRGREDLIQESVKIFDDELNSLKLPKALCYLEGELRDDYLRHMKVAQKFATESRIAMAKNIVNHIGLDFEKLNKFETVHNYINFDDNVVRKGAISANKDEMVLIPMNMRDGSLLCRGKGNEDWNNSAPHGAGRLMSRSQAKESLLYDDFKNSMSDIYSTSVLNSTLDEAPMAYKPMDEIVGNIQDTVEIISVLKPIYNFKAH
jgi:RNA-splicing ligase RtcB